MDNGTGNPGEPSRQHALGRASKARSGAFAGRQYPQDASLKPGRNPITNAGQGTNVVKKTPLDPKAPVGDPWKRPDYRSRVPSECISGGARRSRAARPAPRGERSVTSTLKDWVQKGYRTVDGNSSRKLQNRVQANLGRVG